MHSMSDLKKINFMNDFVKRCNDDFPINNSIEVLKILNYVMSFHIMNQPLSLKVLYTELNVSELCARSNIRRLEENKWLTIKTFDSDSRVRLIKPTDKLISQYHSFCESILILKENLDSFTE